MTEERLCVVCPTRNRRPVHYERAQACEPCRIWLAETLADIAVLYAQLADRHAATVDHAWKTRQLHKGHWVDAPGYDPVGAKLPTGAPGRAPARFGIVTGTREHEAPTDLDVIDLTASAREHIASADARLWREDQVGHAAVAFRLNQWVSDWISTDWCKSNVLPLPNVTDLVAWLGLWVGDACDQHPAVDDFATEIGEIQGALRAYIPRVVEHDETPPRGRPEPRTAPCRGCDMISLWWWPSEERVRCDTDLCGVVMTEDEYAQWARLVLAGEKARG